jgi:hypothetical protein
MPDQFFAAWRRPRTLIRGLKVCSIVGCVVTMINQGPRMLEGEYPALWQVFLTFLVPFMVSTISSALSELHHRGLRHDDKPG